jgi:hypothetical protein
MLRNLVLSAVMVAVGSFAFQRQIDGQTEPVAYYDFTKTAGEPYGPYPMTMVVSASNSLALAVVPAGFHQTPHHHDQEQFTLGVEGRSTIRSAASLITLGRTAQAYRRRMFNTG